MYRDLVNWLEFQEFDGRDGKRAALNNTFAMNVANKILSRAHERSSGRVIVKCIKVHRQLLFMIDDSVWLDVQVLVNGETLKMRVKVI